MFSSLLPLVRHCCQPCAGTPCSDTLIVRQKAWQFVALIAGDIGSQKMPTDGLAPFWSVALLLVQ